jgi:hypothetical protein
MPCARCSNEKSSDTHMASSPEPMGDFVDSGTGDLLALKACFVGGKGDADGTIELSSAMTFAMTGCAHGCCVPTIAVAPAGFLFPLEVGTTSGPRTWGHLVESRGLARWPYGSTAVTFFFVPDTYDIRLQTRQLRNDGRGGHSRELTLRHEVVAPVNPDPGISRAELRRPRIAPRAARRTVSSGTITAFACREVRA